jgi:hypothetical protein
MTTTVFHPATLQLLRLQSRGRRRRMWRKFCQPRRLVLSAIACVLAVVWLGNAAMTVWLRETGSPETLRALLSLGLALYVGWHFAKAAFFRPESPFDWTPAERELLAAMPLRSRDLVAYQLASVTVTTLLKAGLFTLLLWPDLRCVPLGLVGLLLVMMILETLRMAVEIATWGMGRWAFLAYRAAVVAGLVAAGFAVGAVLLREDALGGPIHVGQGPFQGLLGILVQLNASVFSYAALPFQPLVDLILADAMTASKLGLAAAGLGTVMVLAAAVMGLHALTSRGVANRERRNYRPDRGLPLTPKGGFAQKLEIRISKSETSTKSEIRNFSSVNGLFRALDFVLRICFGFRASSFGFPGKALKGRGSYETLRVEVILRRIPRWGGAGALAWRQLLGARRHWGSLLTAMIAPAVLACAPCFVIADPFIALLATTGTLAFYTFLLLPTALRFDFRRDLDRLATLKGLPITPGAAVIGQTLAPVLIATVFQSGVLAFAVVARSLPPHYLVVTILAMIPLNVLVFGLDNLIYLLYPYRVQQEGLEIFLRTMLTFTGKGLLFAVGLVVMSGWGFAAAALTRGISHWTGSTFNAYAVFAGGMIAGPSLLAALVLFGLCRTYRHVDPIEDVPR